MGGDSNILNMDAIIKDSQEYWLNCLAEYELALEEEFLMQPGYGFDDNIIQLLKFEINECIKQLT